MPLRLWLPHPSGPPLSFDQAQDRLERRGEEERQPVATATAEALKQEAASTEAASLVWMAR
jgi:hypothetical protein